MTVQPRNYLSVASIALFLGGLLWMAAFWLPVFKTAERDIAGYWVFVSGWMGFVVFQFAWYANLLLLIAVILMYTSPVRATVFAALGLLVATQAFWFDVLPETTQGITIIEKGPGFWLWYAGIFMMSVGVFFCLDTDEVDDVIETSGPEADVMPLSVQQTVQKAQVRPEIDTVASPQKASPPPTVVEEVATVIPEAEVQAEEVVQEKAPESLVLNKTDEELEATIPAVISILRTAVFPEIKKLG